MSRNMSEFRRKCEVCGEYPPPVFRVWFDVRLAMGLEERRRYACLGCADELRNIIEEELELGGTVVEDDEPIHVCLPNGDEFTI